LICRHAKVSLLPNQLPSDARISSFRLKVPSPELERSLKIKERLESSLTLKKTLLIFVLAGTSMVIANGVVTPAMSGYYLLLLYFAKAAITLCIFEKKSDLPWSCVCGQSVFSSPFDYCLVFIFFV